MQIKKKFVRRHAEKKGTEYVQKKNLFADIHTTPPDD